MDFYNKSLTTYLVVTSGNQWKRSPKVRRLSYRLSLWLLAPMCSCYCLFSLVSLHSFLTTVDLKSVYWFGIITMMFVVSMSFFLLTSTTRPGVLRGTSPVSFLKLVERFDPNLLCPQCEIACTSDSRHCYICNECVSRFDHHCQWVNNCIGGANHRYFLVFICA